MVTEYQLIEIYQYALDCVICFCGNYKRMGKPFCFQCWDSLPSNWKTDNGVIFHGAHEYDAAKQWLKAKRQRDFLRRIQI